jgi:hypothetical protein
MAKGSAGRNDREHKRADLLELPIEAYKLKNDFEKCKKRISQDVTILCLSSS